MGLRYLYDTNIFLYHANDDVTVREFFSEAFLIENVVLTSTIVRIELLSFHNLSLHDERRVVDLLSSFVIVPLKSDIEERTIAYRRAYRLKIPDAIIAVTARSEAATLVTRNSKDSSKIRDLSVLDPFDLKS